MIIACVLKTGGDFRPRHVIRLLDQLAAHAPAEADFLCLTDHPDLLGAEFARPLAHDWPRWWSKIEAFRLPGLCLYLDLDVNIVGDLSPLLSLVAGVRSTDLLENVSRETFLMARGFWGVDDPSHVNSSVMAWSGDASVLYDIFEKSPAAFMAAYSTRRRWGDQRFIADHWPGEIALWQDLLPGAVLSYKRDLLRGVPRGKAAIVASHGEPRPWDRDGADAWLALRR